MFVDWPFGSFEMKATQRAQDIFVYYRHGWSCFLQTYSIMDISSWSHCFASISWFPCALSLLARLLVVLNGRSMYNWSFMEAAAMCLSVTEILPHLQIGREFLRSHHFFDTSEFFILVVPSRFRMTQLNPLLSPGRLSLSHLRWFAVEEGPVRLLSLCTDFHRYPIAAYISDYLCIWFKPIHSDFSCTHAFACSCSHASMNICISHKTHIVCTDWLQCVTFACDVWVTNASMCVLSASNDFALTCTMWIGSKDLHYIWLVNHIPIALTELIDSHQLFWHMRINSWKSHGNVAWSWYTLNALTYLHMFQQLVDI